MPFKIHKIIFFSVKKCVPTLPKVFRPLTREHLFYLSGLNKIFKSKIVIIFLFINFNMCFGCSKVRSHWEYQQQNFKIMFSKNSFIHTIRLSNSLDSDQAPCLASALDKLLGQLGIYATWLSSIAYLQKQLRIFIFFTPHFFLWLHIFLLHEAIGNVLAYLFIPIVCLSKVSNSRIFLYLVDIRACKLCKVSLSSFFLRVFPRNTGLGTNIFIKLEYIARSLVKNKINTRLAFVY